MNAPPKKHAIGILTAAVLALAAGTAQQQGYLPRWEGMTNPKTVNGQRVSIAIHQSFDPKGIITVCDGITNYDIPALKEGDIYTAVMCGELLKSRELPKYNAMLASCLPTDFMVSDHQHVAMLSFIYNVGKGNFCNSSVGRLFREGKRNEACEAMGLYVRAAGVVLPGLKNRRYDKFYGEIAWCKRDD